MVTPDKTPEQRAQAWSEFLEFMADPANQESHEVWRQVLRGIDEERPHRPLFEGLYAKEEPVTPVQKEK